MSFNILDAAFAVATTTRIEAVATYAVSPICSVLETATLTSCVRS